MTGDVSLLPECLNVTFQASAETDDAYRTETQWCFFAAMQSTEFNQTVAYYDEKFATPGVPFKDYSTLLDFITTEYPDVTAFVPGDPSVDPLIPEPVKRRSLKQNANDASAACESGGIDLFERRDENWTGTYSGCVEDADNAQLVAAYKILDDDIMVFRYPEFGPIYSSVEAWRNAVDFARDNNATKLLFDMIGNPGGDIDTQYFMRLALYPLMPYDDWKDDYTQRVSPKMLKIINYIAQGSAVISLLAEYSEEVMAALEERTVSVDGLLGSIQSILQTIDNFRATTGFLIGTEGQIVGALLSDAQDRFEQIANGTKAIHHRCHHTVPQHPGWHHHEPDRQIWNTATVPRRLKCLYHRLLQPYVNAPRHLGCIEEGRIRPAFRELRPAQQWYFRQLGIHVRAGCPGVRQEVRGRGDPSHSRVLRLPGRGRNVSPDAIFGRTAWRRKRTAQCDLFVHSRRVCHQPDCQHPQRDRHCSDGGQPGLPGGVHQQTRPGLHRAHPRRAVPAEHAGIIRVQRPVPACRLHLGERHSHGVFEPARRCGDRPVAQARIHRRAVRRCKPP